MSFFLFLAFVGPYIGLAVLEYLRMRKDPPRSQPSTQAPAGPITTN